MNINPPGYIFLCSKKTEAECFERMLFGITTKSISQEGLIKPGDPVMLFNMTATRLHGIYEATSENKLNIEPEAWGGNYPMQVSVKLFHRYESLGPSDIYGLIPYKGRFPKATLNPDEFLKLYNKFIHAKPLPKIEDDFRQKYPAKVYTKDGHWVRSGAEKAIDEWLFDQQICHAYEMEVPTDERMFCDFLIPRSVPQESIYIEYWGLEDENYLERKLKKQAYYRDNNLILIELTKKDIDHLDIVLPQKLHPYFPDKGY